MLRMMTNALFAKVVDDLGKHLLSLVDGRKHPFEDGELVELGVPRKDANPRNDGHHDEIVVAQNCDDFLSRLVLDRSGLRSAFVLYNYPVKFLNSIERLVYPIYNDIANVERRFYIDLFHHD